MNKKESAWFTGGEKSSGKKVRLFCFPYAGGGASIFRDWSKHLPLHIDICPVQLPARENRLLEKPVTKMDDVIEILSKEIEDYLDLPFIIYGHSLGARIGFELTRRLRGKKMKQPLHLIVSGSRPPEIPEPTPLHKLSDEDFLEELKRFSGTPSAVLENKELMSVFIPGLRGDFSIDETWIFLEDDALDIPVTAFFGTNDLEANRQEMAGWEKHTSSDFELIPVKGEHFFINDEKEAFLKLLSHHITKNITISTL